MGAGRDGAPHLLPRLPRPLRPPPAHWCVESTLGWFFPISGLTDSTSTQTHIAPPPPGNYPLLIGDLSVLLSFRSVEDTLTTPFPTLDIAASPDMIAKGLITYADPLHAAAHIYAVVADGMTLGLFWLLAVMWGEAEAVDMATSRSFTLSALNVFKSWLALCNTRLLVLFAQVRACVRACVAWALLLTS